MKGPATSYRPGEILAILAASLVVGLFKKTEARAGDGVQTAGDVLEYALPTAAAGLTLVNRDGKGAFQLGESLALSIGSTYALQYTVDERRPNGGKHSFPSAHTTVAFTAAEFLRKHYGWEYGVPAYAAASFVAYSRVESRQHHPQDVIAGAGIGILSSFIFTKPYKGWQVSLEGDTRSFEVEVALKF